MPAGLFDPDGVPFVPPRQEGQDEPEVDPVRTAVAAEQAEVHKCLGVANQRAPGEAGVGAGHVDAKVRQFVERHSVRSRREREGERAAPPIGRAAGRSESLVDEVDPCHLPLMLADHAPRACCPRWRWSQARPWREQLVSVVGDLRIQGRGGDVRALGGCFAQREPVRVLQPAKIEMEGEPRMRTFIWPLACHVFCPSSTPQTALILQHFLSHRS